MYHSREPDFKQRAVEDRQPRGPDSTEKPKDKTNYTDRILTGTGTQCLTRTGKDSVTDGTALHLTIISALPSFILPSGHS